MRGVVSALLGTILVVGCTSPASGPTTGAAPSPTAAGTPAPKRGGSVVIATATDPGHFNPAITTAGGTHFVAGSLYNGLVSLDEKGDPQPDLAERWVIGDGGRSYTFTLRSGVRWHDGRELTSADVKFSFEEVLLKFHARTRAGLAPALAGIDAPDPRTVVFRFREPYGPLLQRLDNIEAPIVARHVYEGSDPATSPANLRPVGTGPFRLAEYVKGDRVRLVRNESYFRAGLPYLDELIFRIIPQASTQVLALERGEVDYLGSVPGPDLARLQASADLVMQRSGAGSGGSYCIQTLIFNLSNAELAKREVRHAFGHAIDKQQILQQVQFGQGRVANAAIASTLAWAHEPNATTYPLDRARSERLLDGAGLARGADGVRLRVRFVHAASFAKHAELIKQHLAPVGVDVQLVTLEVNAANDRVFIRKDFDLGIASYCNGPDPEIGVRRVYVSSNIGPILFSNGAGYREPAVDRLFDQAATTADRAARGRAYREIQQILARDLPYIWLVETEGFRAWRKDFQGFSHWSSNLAESASKK